VTTEHDLLSVSEIINFEGGVSADFMAQMMRHSAKYWKAKSTLSIPQMELLRRACAVIEAVMTDNLQAK